MLVVTTDRSIVINSRLIMDLDSRDSRLIASRVMGDRRICEVFYRGGLRQGLHRHRLAALSFVASGHYQENLGRQAHSRNAATIVFHPADECHAVVFESDVSIVSVEFRALGGIGDTADILSSGSSHRSELVSWLGTRLRREVKRSDGASQLSIEGIISELLAEGSRAKVLSRQKGPARWLARATDYIHDNFATTFMLDDIAAVAGVHPAHLSRVFRQKMGCTVGEYVRRLRFEFACQQILTTERSLCAVAYEAGFADQSHFHRLFRRRMGVTPHAYRRIHVG